MEVGGDSFFDNTSSLVTNTRSLILFYYVHSFVHSFIRSFMQSFINFFLPVSLLFVGDPTTGVGSSHPFKGYKNLAWNGGVAATAIIHR